ncbi:MAG: STAS domain-containing protein [Bacteroidetes bacterium]|nr:STAS domain-containing protein [Bacteroidota bacterium]
MHFSLDKTEKYVVIKLHEQKLNTLIAAELKSELLLLNTQGFNNIILDLVESLYCDSSGLSAILVGNRLCRNANGSFVITGLSDTVMKLVQISQLDQVLNIALTSNDAIDFILETEEEQKIENKVEKNIKN